MGYFIGGCSYYTIFLKADLHLRLMLEGQSIQKDTEFKDEVT